MSIGIGILGAAGRAAIAEVGQRGLSRLADHPTLEIRALLADDPDDVGKCFGDVVTERWVLPDEDAPEQWFDSRLVGIDGPGLRDAGVDLVLSGLSGPRSAELEPALAAAGVPIVSGSMGMRMQPDVPLVVAGLNNDHLDLVGAQKQSRGWDSGFVVAGPLCTATITALVCKPVHDAFGISTMMLTTMQAISGTGQSGLPAMRIVDNVLTYIPDEEEKMSRELVKVLGTRAGEEITPAPLSVAATCTRVPVRNGHTVAVTLSLDNPATPAEIDGVLREARSADAGPDSPLTPIVPLVVMDDPHRPQPLLDRETGGGRVVSVGRIREQPALKHGIGLVAVGHNHERGTWGNALMLCEAVAARGLIS